eukprot:scaffold11670_cov136-Isochrysis_galbana.AAC.4
MNEDECGTRPRCRLEALARKKETRVRREKGNNLLCPRRHEAVVARRDQNGAGTDNPYRRRNPVRSRREGTESAGVERAPPCET